MKKTKIKNEKMQIEKTKNDFLRSRPVFRLAVPSNVPSNVPTKNIRFAQCFYWVSLLSLLTFSFDKNKRRERYIRGIWHIGLYKSKGSQKLGGLVGTPGTRGFFPRLLAGCGDARGGAPKKTEATPGLAEEIETV
jgi:hypothetical protein